MCWSAQVLQRWFSSCKVTQSVQILSPYWFTDLIICLSIYPSPHPLSLHPFVTYRWCLQRREADQPETDCGRGSGEVQGKVSPTYKAHTFSLLSNRPCLHQLLVMGLSPWHMTHWTHTAKFYQLLSGMLRIHTGQFTHYGVSRQHGALRFIREAQAARLLQQHEPERM